MADRSRSLSDRLSDIEIWSEKLARYLSGATLASFANDEMAVDAATKCIEVIGEAAKHILQARPDLREHYPELKLFEAYQTRNRLSHGYFDVDPRRVWETAHSAVPELVAAVRQILREMPEGRE